MRSCSEVTLEAVTSPDLIVTTVPRSPYAKLQFVRVGEEEFHEADIRIMFGRYQHGD